MASITLDRVSKVFAGGHAAARDVSLDIAEGELLVLVGPSGSGKSTVLRLIAGLDLPTGGRVLIGGDDVTGVGPQQRDLAMVFQNYALYPHKSVRDNLAFGLRVRRVAPAEIEARIRRTAAALDIEALLDRRPAQLSGGQRQRVALGRAIVREPRAFLLDEPLSNLDPLLRADARAELVLLHRRLAATMVYVTHDQEEAMTLGTRLAVMRDGQLEQLGPPLTVYERPATTFVARFVGSPAMNLWRRRPERGAEVIVGARPQDIELTSPETGETAGRIEVVERLGSQTVLHIGVPGEPELTRVVTAPERAGQVGDSVGFKARPDRLHYFDPQTGRRVETPTRAAGS